MEQVNDYDMDIHDSIDVEEEKSVNESEVDSADGKVVESLGPLFNLVNIRTGENDRALQLFLRIFYDASVSSLGFSETDEHHHHGHQHVEHHQGSWG